MINYKRLPVILSFILASLILVTDSACIKEYSYEREAIQDSTFVEEPLPVAGFSLPFCSTCDGRDTGLLSTWSFKTDSIFSCGKNTNAIISPERTAFTFFSPSACSPDTGLIMTVYLNGIVLDSDKSGISTNRVIFQYYDKGGPDILLSRPLPGFTLKIDTYTHQTRIASGSFTGNAATQNGDIILIKEGKFNIKFQ